MIDPASMSTCPGKLRGSVLISLPNCIAGGAGTHVYHLSLLLREAGCSVALLVHPDFGRRDGTRDRLASRGVEMVSTGTGQGGTPLGRAVRFWRSVRASLGGRRFNLVIAEGPGSSHGLLVPYISRNGRFIYHEHSDGAQAQANSEDFRQLDPLPYPWRVRAAMRLANMALVGCERGRNHLISVQGLGCPVRVIPPLRRIDPAPSRARERNVAHRAVRIGVFSFLRPGKGILPLLSLWPALNIGPHELHFYGPDPGGMYESAARRLGLGPEVQFLGGYSDRDLPELMDRVDLGLLPSLREGCSLTICEFMAYGVPFVTTDVGSAPEMTRDNPDAIMAPLSEQGVKHALETMVLRVRSGVTSRLRLQAYYERSWSFSRIAADYIAMLLGEAECAGLSGTGDSVVASEEHLLA